MEQCKRNLREMPSLCFRQEYVFKPLPCRTQFTAPQVTGSGFSIKPSANYSLSRTIQRTYTCVYGIEISFPYNISLKIYVKICKSCVKLEDDY